MDVKACKKRICSHMFGWLAFWVGCVLIVQKGKTGLLLFVQFVAGVCSFYFLYCFSSNANFSAFLRSSLLGLPLFIPPKYSKKAVSVKTFTAKFANNRVAFGLEFFPKCRVVFGDFFFSCNCAG